VLVTRIKSSPAHSYGTINAPTAEAAIRKAAERYQITDQHELKRLAARPVAQ
jgi:hypothetical protein